MGVPSTSPVDFLEFFPGNRNHHHFSDDAGCHELQLVCHREVGHCEVEDEDEDAAGGFPRGSPHLVAIPKMIMLLAQVDHVNHFANSLSEHAVLEPRFPFEKDDPWSSCISLFSMNSAGSVS